MKKLTTISICAFLAIAAGFTSCKKSSNNNTTPTPTPSTPSNTPPTPTPAGVSGVLVSLSINVTTVAAGMPYTVTTETGVATFMSSPGSTTYVDAGTVSVNTYSLDKQSNNSYLKTATIGSAVTDLNFSSNSSNWSVGGSGSVTAFTYNDNATFPKFTGTVPETVTRSSGVTISLSGNVTGNPDSVLLFIAQGSSSIVRTVAGNASSVTIAASELSSWPTVSNNSAILEVVPYKITTSTQGGKSYAFIKEYAAVKNININ